MQTDASHLFKRWHTEFIFVLIRGHKLLCCENSGEILERVIVHSHSIMKIDLFSFYVLFSHFKPRDALMGICLLFFSLVVRTFVRA